MWILIKLAIVLLATGAILASTLSRWRVGRLHRTRWRAQVALSLGALMIAASVLGTLMGAIPLFVELLEIAGMAVLVGGTLIAFLGPEDRQQERRE